MKAILAAMLLLGSTALAGTEVVYFTPFEEQFVADVSLHPTHLTFDHVSLISAPTKVAVDDSACGYQEDDLNCEKRTVLESVPAVEVNMSYQTNTVESDSYPYISGKVYLRPETLPAATLALLKGHGLSGNKAAKYFTVNTEQYTETVQVVDNEASTFCDTEDTGICKDHIVYKDATVERLKITVQPK